MYTKSDNGSKKEKNNSKKKKKPPFYAIRLLTDTVIIARFAEKRWT